MIRPRHPQVPAWLNPHRIVGGKSESWLAKGSSYVENVPQEACRMWSSGPGFGTDYVSGTEERVGELRDTYNRRHPEPLPQARCHQRTSRVRDPGAVVESSQT